MAAVLPQKTGALLPTHVHTFQNLGIFCFQRFFRNLNPALGYATCAGCASLSSHASSFPPLQMHPRFRSLPPLHTYIWLGEDAQRSNQRDPLADGLEQELGYVRRTITLENAGLTCAHCVLCACECLMVPFSTVTQKQRGQHLLCNIWFVQLLYKHGM